MTEDAPGDGDMPDKTDDAPDDELQPDDPAGAQVSGANGGPLPESAAHEQDDAAGAEAASLDGDRSPNTEASKSRSWRNLRRSDDDRIIAGVAGGLAEWLDISAVAVRIGFVVLTFFGGAGALIYLIGWLAIPAANGTSLIATAFSGSDRGDHSSSRWRSIGAVVLGALAIAVIVGLTSELFRGFGRGPWNASAVAVVLLCAGAALVLWPGRQRPGTPAAAPPPAAPQATAPSLAAPLPDAAATDTGTAAMPSTAPVESPAPRPSRDWASRRRRSLVSAVCMAALLIYAGAIAILHGTGTLDAEIAPTLAGALAIAGAGVVVSAFTTPARGLMFVGLVLAAGLVLTSGSRTSWAAGIGETHVSIDGNEIAETELRHGFGRLVADFGNYRPRAGTHEFDIELAAGELEILLPDNLAAMVEADVGTGSVTHSYRQVHWRHRFAHHEGVGVSQHLELHANPEPVATVELDIDVGIGSVDIVSVPALDPDTEVSDS